MGYFDKVTVNMTSCYELEHKEDEKVERKVREKR